MPSEEQPLRVRLKLLLDLATQPPEGRDLNPGDCQALDIDYGLDSARLSPVSVRQQALEAFADEIATMFEARA